MEIAGIAAFLAAGLLIASVLVKDPDTTRYLRFGAAAALIAGGVWLVIVMAPAFLAAG
ncbi:MAG: hypothetical protein Q4G43_07535 [Mobilicoccus sp.]|nr:hypothetical protein [Mobilicoccus sp.]